MKIIVASRNPVKLSASRLAFEAVFGVVPGVVHAEVASGVGAQPRSDAETLVGATTRALNAAQAFPDAEFAVGLEGGVEDTEYGMLAFAWGVVRARTGEQGRGRTASFFLPDAVAALVRAGKELGEADGLVFGQTNSKQKMGAVGLLTRGLIDRTTLYRDALVLALIPFSKSSP